MENLEWFPFLGLVILAVVTGFVLYFKERKPKYFIGGYDDAYLSSDIRRIKEAVEALKRDNERRKKISYSFFRNADGSISYMATRGERTIEFKLEKRFPLSTARWCKNVSRFNFETITELAKGKPFGFVSFEFLVWGEI